MYFYRETERSDGQQQQNTERKYCNKSNKKLKKINENKYKKKENDNQIIEVVPHHNIIIALLVAGF